MKSICEVMDTDVLVEMEETRDLWIEFLRQHPLRIIGTKLKFVFIARFNEGQEASAELRKRLQHELDQTTYED